MLRTPQSNIPHKSDILFIAHTPHPFNPVERPEFGDIVFKVTQAIRFPSIVFGGKYLLNNNSRNNLGL